MPRRSFTRLAKKVKPPETSSTFMPAALQAATSCSAPGIEPQALVVDLLQRVDRHAFEQRHAAAQAFLEVLDLAAHRGLGDGGDFGLLADRVGDLVDALDVDQRRVHVERDQLEVGAARAAA